MQLFCVWARSYFGPADIGLVLFCCIKARHTESATERAGHLTRHFTSGRFSSRSCTGSRPTEAPCVTGNGRCGKNMKNVHSPNPMSDHVLVMNFWIFAIARICAGGKPLPAGAGHVSGTLATASAQVSQLNMTSLVRLKLC